MASLGTVMRKLATAAASRVSPRLASDLKLGRYARTWILPRDSGVREHFVPSHTVGHAGFDLHIDDQLARIRAWRDDRYQRLFRELREDRSINTGKNGQT